MLGVGVGAAIYLIGVPLAMLLFAAFRGPADFLPFEPGAQLDASRMSARCSPTRCIYTRILPDTFVFVAGTVALVFVMAFGLAWLVERTDLPGREIWFSLILFPLLVPTPVLAIAWIFLMGPNAGWLNLVIRAALGLEGSGPINIFSMGGLILCQALASTPFVFLLLTSTLRAMDPALEEASGASGASPLTTFRRVTLPVLLPGLLAPLDPGHADHRRAVRAAADHRPAGQDQRVQLSHLFRAQPALQPAQLRRRRGAVAAVRRARRAAAARSTTA